MFASLCVVFIEVFFVTASMLHTIHTHFNDVEGKCVADLGVGSGVLSVGCSMLGCR